MIIRIARLGTSIKEVQLDAGCVDDALAASGLSVEGFQIRLDGKIVGGRHPLQDGDIITLVLAGGIRGAHDIKVNNHKWRVLQNDPDDIFPSDFHAHNKSGRKETVNLYNGEVFDATTGQVVRQLSKKHFNQFYEELNRKRIRRIKGQSNT